MDFEDPKISRELAHAGLDEYVLVWEEMVRAGLCTMDPCMVLWVRQCLGMEISESTLHSLKVVVFFAIYF